MKQARGVLPMLALAWLVVVTTASNINENFEQLTVAEMCGLLPADTSFLRPTTCNHWVRCAASGTRLEEGACATGLYYNKDKGRCTAESASCPYLDTQSSANACAKATDGTFLADPTSTSCRGYILCQAHTELYANCPNNLVFNPASHSCVYANQYECPTASMVNNSSPACRALPNNTHIADTEQCNKYYVCADEVLQESYCGAQMAYDVAQGRCVPQSEVKCYSTASLPAPENLFCLNSTGGARQGYFADDESCSHYYICGSPSPFDGKHDTEPQHMQCDRGQYFDLEKLSCRDRLNVKCSLDRCLGTDLTYVNVAGDCQNYARCSSGRAVDKGRCPDGYYFDERSQGCTPTNYNYIACANVKSEAVSF